MMRCIYIYLRMHDILKSHKTIWLNPDQRFRGATLRSMGAPKTRERAAVCGGWDDGGVRGSLGAVHRSVSGGV